MTQSRIFLIGMMGTGKSFWGARLADRLGWRFIDLDALIESEQGKSIPEIFDLAGEASFRSLEQQYLMRLLEMERVVVATGGGTPCFFNNMVRMCASGFVIYLRTPVQELTRRLESEDQSRPMLRGAGQAGLQLRVVEILALREPVYARAHCTLDTLDPDFEARLYAAISSE